MDDKELREQIAHLQAELERRRFEKRRNGGAGAVATAAPVPPPPPLTAALKTCPVCLSPRPDRGPCPGCSFEPVQGLGKPAAKPEEPAVLETLRGFFVRGLALVREQGFERFLGERLFAYVGMVLVVLGGAFFLKYAAQHSGPWGRVAVGALAGAGAAVAGELLSRRSRLKALSVPVTAGGWALLLYTAYAAHAVPASKVVADPRLALVLLAAAAGGMIVHALSARSRLLTAFAFAVSYFAFAATDFGTQTLGVTTVLALAGAWLTRAQRQPELVPIGLVGFAVNYWPTLERSFGVHSIDPAQAAVSIGAAAGVYGATALAARPEDMDPREGAWVDASLAFGALLLAAAVHSHGGTFLGAAGAGYGLLVAALLAFLAGRRGEGGGAATLQTFLAAGLAALSCWRMDTVAGQLWAFALAVGALALSGAALRRESFKRYALALSGLAGLTWLFQRPTDSLPAAAALAALGALGYASAWHGGDAPERAGSRRPWLHGGLLMTAAAVSEAGCDPLMRLPAACLAALALLILGRRRGALGADLRVQAYGLAAAAPVIGAATYLWPGGAAALTTGDALRYGASSLVLLGPLAFGGWGRTPEEAVEERAAGHIFAALSVAMTSLFVLREASGPALTLWWTALGGGYLLAGLLAERRELRWPALALLGLCVAKAFFHDLTGLALPWRMLSMSVLGLLLVLCSLAYVRWVKEEPSVLSLPEGDGSAARGMR
jgi:hypothetical protein